MVSRYSAVRTYFIFNLGSRYKDVCFIIKLYVSYRYMFYVSEYVFLTFSTVLKERDNSCKFPRMVKNNPEIQKAHIPKTNKLTRHKTVKLQNTKSNKNPKSSYLKRILHPTVMIENHSRLI